jgi:hypothetical protein
MKYVKHQHDQHWILVTPEQEDDEYLQYHGIWKLVDHEIIGEWDLTKWKPVERLVLQKSLRIVHRHHTMSPIDAYEPDRPTIIDPEEQSP